MPRPRAIPDTLLELLNESSRPIYAVDERRRVVFCNPALTTWLELEPGRVIGRFVEYHSETVASGDAKTDSSAPLADLCPPPRAFTGERCIGTISCAIRGGRLAHRSTEFIPLPHMPDARGRTREVCSVLALLGDRDLSPEELAASADPTADELHRTIRRFRRSQAVQYSLESLLGNSAAMQQVRAQVAAAAASGANTLVRGAPGSGRSHIARAIHYQGTTDPPPRLVPVDCKTATEDSLRRAFESLHAAGDSRQRPTLLLENLDYLQPTYQAEILESSRRGSLRARVIATCEIPMPYHEEGSAEHENRLKAAEKVRSKAQRASDDASKEELHPVPMNPALVTAISTIAIRIPRLRERPEDLPLLAQYLLEECNRGSKQVERLRSDALDRLALHTWPGEIHELRAVIAAAHKECRSYEITPADLSVVVHHAQNAASHRRSTPETIDLDALIGRIEREAVERALAQAGGNKTEAAALLGMTRPRFYRRLMQLGLAEAGPDNGDSAPEFTEQFPSDDTP